MKLLFWCISLILLVSTVNVYADNQDPYPFTSSVEADRFHALTREIRCVVCQNQNIADSNAPLANDLRDKVYQMVLAQQSNNEIKDYLVKRYGEFILLQPRFNKSTIALWLFPFVGIVTIFSVLLRFMYRRR